MADAKKEEKDVEKTAQADHPRYGTFGPSNTLAEHHDSPSLWKSFAYENPQEFLKLIIDDFAGLRLVQALFVNACIGLARSAMGKSANHAAQLCGGFSGFSVFCNLFGIIMSIVVSSQCSGMKSMHATGDQVVAAIPKLFMLFYVTMMSFLLGMVSMAAGVIAILSTSQTWAVCIFLCVLSFILLVFLVYVMTTYAFGTSVITHAATLALESLPGATLTAFRGESLPGAGIHALGNASVAGAHWHRVAHKSSEERKASATHEKMEGTTKEEKSTEPTDKAAAAGAAAGP